MTPREIATQIALEAYRMNPDRFPDEDDLIEYRRELTSDLEWELQSEHDSYF